MERTRYPSCIGFYSKDDLACNGDKALPLPLKEPCKWRLFCLGLREWAAEHKQAPSVTLASASVDYAELIRIGGMAGYGLQGHRRAFERRPHIRRGVDRALTALREAFNTSVRHAFVGRRFTRVGLVLEPGTLFVEDGLDNANVESRLLVLFSLGLGAQKIPVVAVRPVATASSGGAADRCTCFFPVPSDVMGAAVPEQRWFKTSGNASRGFISMTRSLTIEEMLGLIEVAAKLVSQGVIKLP